MVIKIDAKPEYYETADARGVRNYLPSDKIDELNSKLKEGWLVKNQSVCGSSTIFILEKE